MINSFTKSFGNALVMYTDENGIEKSINVSFTSLNIINPFIEINRERCDFLYEDMLTLSEETKRIANRIKC